MDGFIPQTCRTLRATGFLVALAIGVWLGFRVHKASNSPPTTLPLTIRQITTWPGLDSNPAFSPDGESIAYSSDHTGNFEIYIRSIAPGGREIQLTTDGEQNFDPAWSPDSKTVAVFSDEGQKGQNQLWTVSADGSNPKKLTSLKGYAARPHWSHDGKQIAFLYIEGAGGGGPLRAAPGR